MSSFSAKYMLLELKKYTGVIFHETEEGYKIWGKSTRHFKIGTMNLTNIDLRARNSQKISL